MLSITVSSLTVTSKAPSRIARSLRSRSLQRGQKLGSICVDCALCAVHHDTLCSKSSREFVPRCGGRELRAPVSECCNVSIPLRSRVRWTSWSMPNRSMSLEMRKFEIQGRSHASCTVKGWNLRCSFAGSTDFYVYLSSCVRRYLYLYLRTLSLPSAKSGHI